MSRSEISGEELERRLRRVAQLRNTILLLRRSALEQWRQGKSPIRPRIDERSDLEYWMALEREEAD
jgi:hypothetical protein